MQCGRCKKDVDDTIKLLWGDSMNYELCGFCYKHLTDLISDVDEELTILRKQKLAIVLQKFKNSEGII